MAPKYFAWALLLLAAAVHAEPGYLVSRAQGVLRIAPDGSVEHVDLRTDLLLSDELAMEGLVKKWRFQPVLDGQGRPTSARTEATLTLLAMTGDDGRTRVGVQSAVFHEPELDWKNAPGGAVVASPVWPRKTDRGGAMLVLRLRMGEEGRPREAMLQGGWATLRAAGSGEEADRMIERFVQASREAALQWRFPGNNDCVLDVPVIFWLPFEGWQPARPLVSSAQGGAGDSPCEGLVGEGGRPVARRFNLLTPLARFLPPELRRGD